jgi:hypothetical protein
MIKEQRRLDHENEFLLKKLISISKRKKEFIDQTKEEKIYYALHAKSRNWQRKKKERQLLEENYKIVEKIESQKNRSPSSESSPDWNKIKKKTNHRKHRNQSSIFPSIPSAQ